VLESIDHAVEGLATAFGVQLQPPAVAEEAAPAVDSSAQQNGDQVG
jgi:hypothetical protein